MPRLVDCGDELLLCIGLELMLVGFGGKLSFHKELVPKTVNFRDVLSVVLLGRIFFLIDVFFLFHSYSQMIQITNVFTLSFKSTHY